MELRMQYLNVKQVAALIGRSTNNVYDLVDKGHLPRPVKLGGVNSWREDLVHDHIASLANEQGAGWSKVPPRPVVIAAPPALPGARA